jgi:hypothetical protein
MKKILKSKKGMSLMEILVGGILLGMVALTVSAVLAPFMLAFSRANDLAEYSTILDTVGNQIVSDLVRSSEEPTTAVNRVDITVDSEDDVIYTIRQAAGVLIDGVPAGSLLRHRNAENIMANGECEVCSIAATRDMCMVFPEGFYKRKVISFEVTGTPDAEYTITVTVGPRGNTVATGGSGAAISRDYTVKPLILS